MIRTLNIFPSSKTDEILARYRPIAPKPLIFPQNPLLPHPPNENLQQTPSLKRSRKRSRARISPAAPKRAKAHVGDLTSSDLSSPSLSKKTERGLSLHGLGLAQHGFPSFTLPGHVPSSNDLVTLPLMPYACTAAPTLLREAGADGTDRIDSSPFSNVVQEGMLDLNLKPEVPEEKDLLQKLQAAPFHGSKSSESGHIIMPQPVRPVGSSISVGCICEGSSPFSTAPVLKRAEEVEEEIESDSMPSVVSDSKNKVRFANSAYKELLGQPECPWLDTMVAKDGSGAAACKRISGEVLLDLSDTAVSVSSNRFSCRAKIEWASNGKKIFMDAPCDVVRLFCEAKDYLFTWRFLMPKPTA